MNGAAEATEQIKEAALAHYDALWKNVAAAAKAIAALRAADDLHDALRYADCVSLACEAVAGAAKVMHEATDDALVSVMEGTGASSLRTETHTVSTRRLPAAVDIPDESAVPEEYLACPKPKPDRAKIRAALLSGAAINWATLREGGVTLQRRNCA